MKRRTVFSTLLILFLILLLVFPASATIVGTTWNQSNSSPSAFVDGYWGANYVPIPDPNFNETEPWRSMGRIVIDGQTMVQVKKHYYRTENVTTSDGMHWMNFSISDVPATGYTVDPWHVVNGTEVPWVYIGAYEASTWNVTTGYNTGDFGGVPLTTSKLSSVAGMKPTSGKNNTLTLPNFRTLAQNRGTGWELQPFSGVSVIERMYIIEYRNWGSQTVIGSGVTQITDDGTTNMAVNTGYTSSLGNATGQVNITHYSTGQYTYPNTYRGVENFYGNIWKWVDGLKIKADNKPWIADHDFASDVFAQPYVDTGLTLPAANGYGSNLAYATGFDWAFLPSAVAGSSSTYQSDYYYQATGNRSALFGGYWNNGAYAGASFWLLSYAASDVYRYVGARLAFTPPLYANYTYTNTSANFTFTDESFTISTRTGLASTPTSWNWSFGDGTLSTLQNPTHAYAAAGTYTVNLTVSDGINYATSLQTVSSPNPLVVSFTPPGPVTVWYPNGVLFTDTSTGSPTSWDWKYKLNDIGAGTTFNTTRNATFFPPSVGNFTISLNASTISSYNISAQTTWVNVSQADFLRNVTMGYQYPMAVQFTDMSTGVPTNWSWTFGDTYTSTQQNPLHIYTVAGVYNVNLTVWNSTWGFVSTDKSVELVTDDDTYLKSWKHFNSSILNDEKGVTWTASGTPVLDTSVKKFGAGSLYIPTGNNYIWSPSSPIWDRSVLAGEVEFWINVTSYGDAGKQYIRRSSGTSGTTNGWGMLNINGTRYGNAFWYGNGATNYTTPFDLAPNTWYHLALVRNTSQYWNVYINGVRYGSSVYMGGLDVDTTNPFMIGSSGPGIEPSFHMDEFRYSQGVPRFVSDFSTPYTQYFGSSQLMIDTSLNSTYRYKTNPDQIAIIYNQTNGGVRNRTVQVQNISEALYLIGGGNFDPEHEKVRNVYLNTTDYSDLVLESYSIDNAGGTVAYNVSRGGINHITAPFDTRTNFLDVQVLYYNYTENVGDFQYFAYGYLINDSSTYPVHNFIATPITYGMWGTPIVDFSADNTTPNVLSTVTFTDASTNYPNAWLWDFGDGTTSTLQNPSHVYSTLGLKTVSLTSYLSWNTSITNSTTKVGYINVLSSSGVPSADFSASPLITNIGNIVSFTDLSTGAPTSWVWAFGDSSGSAAQNPTHAYSAFGDYTVNLTVANANGTTTLSRTAYINVSNVSSSGINTQDLYMDPQFTMTMHITDSTTNAAIPVVTVTDSNGVTYITTNGTAYFTEPYAAVVFYVTSEGYTGKSVSYVMDEDREVTVQLVPTVISQQNTWYTPKQIGITVSTYNPAGAHVIGAPVSLAVNGTSLQDDEQLQTMYGINPIAANQMMNGTLLMSGTTGADGVVAFTVLSSLRYDVAVTDPTTSTVYRTQIFPSDYSYTVWIGTNPLTLSTQETEYLNNTALYITQSDKYNVTYNLRYQDTSGYTTDVMFIIKSGKNMTNVYSVDLGNPGTSVVYANKTYPNVRGDIYYLYYNATRVLP
ncbi:MAG: PKD domain-containing protein [Proteiniphilum sp.]|nr:PKD domain-containing protein [Proteiniphilum sp.]